MRHQGRKMHIMEKNEGVPSFLRKVLPCGFTCKCRFTCKWFDVRCHIQQERCLENCNKIQQERCLEKCHEVETCQSWHNSTEPAEGSQCLQESAVCRAWDWTEEMVTGLATCEDVKKCV